MDKWQTLDEFWSSFDIPAYDENSVPDDAVMPYITYMAETAGFEVPVLLTASIWYMSTSWKAISNKADEVASRLSPYCILKMDNDEYLFITKGSPFAQRMKDEDDRVKRVYLNVMAEYFSAS